VIQIPRDSNAHAWDESANDGTPRGQDVSVRTRAMTAARIGRRAGVSAHTVRYYTRQGLLSPRRDPRNRYCLYDDSDCQRIRFARRAQCLGYTLADIGCILRAADGDASELGAAQKVIAEHLAQTRHAVDALAWFDAVLADGSRSWLRSLRGAPDSSALERLVQTAGAALPD